MALRRSLLVVQKLWSHVHFSGTIWQTMSAHGISVFEHVLRHFLLSGQKVTNQFPSLLIVSNHFYHIRMRETGYQSNLIVKEPATLLYLVDRISEECGRALKWRTLTVILRISGRQSQFWSKDQASEALKRQTATMPMKIVFEAVRYHQQMGTSCRQQLAMRLFNIVMELSIFNNQPWKQDRHVFTSLSPVYAFQKLFFASITDCYVATINGSA